MAPSSRRFDRNSAEIPRTPTAELLDLLAVDELKPGIFAAVNPADSTARMFGGQLVAQALAAASRTVPAEKLVHVLHCVFASAASTGAELLYQVECLRDGRAFSVRQVSCWQGGRQVLGMYAGFHLPEPGFEHHAPVDGGSPEPGKLDPFTDWNPAYQDAFMVRVAPVQLRVSEPAATNFTKEAWLWAVSELPADPRTHRLVLAYASDMLLLSTATQPHGYRSGAGPGYMASLNHSMWFHRSCRADEWLSYRQYSPSASGGRAYVNGGMYRRSGELDVNVAQEGLVRLRP